MYLEITYYHTLYKREVTDIVCGEVKMEDGKAVFASMGRTQAVELEYVRSIKPVE